MGWWHKKYMNMKNNKLPNWTIDQVLDPKSNFWDKIREDMEMYIEALDSTAIKQLGKTDFNNRIADFITYFKTKAFQSGILKDIEETSEVIDNALWKLIPEEDREQLFDNDIEYFSDWIDSCPSDLLDIYIKALARGESLNSIKEKPLTMTDLIHNANVEPDMCNVSVYNGMLVLCSSNQDLLEKFKIVMEESGNEVKEYRTDVRPDNLTVYSYIFEIKKV